MIPIPLLFNGCIRHGLFPEIGYTQRLCRKKIQRKMFSLEITNPECFSRDPSGRQQRDRPVPTEADVAKMLNNCVNTREALLLQLLATTGLRAEAISNLTFEHIWDQRKKCARALVRVREKNSTERVIKVSTVLSTAITAFVESYGAMIPSSFIFPSPKGPAFPNKHGVARMLLSICKRSGLPLFSPHVFRCYVTNLIIQKGNSLEQASKYLSHKSPVTTYIHYWTDNCIGLPFNL